MSRWTELVRVSRRVAHHLRDHGVEVQEQHAPTGVGDRFYYAPRWASEVWERSGEPGKDADLRAAAALVAEGDADALEDFIYALRPDVRTQA